MKKDHVKNTDGSIDFYFGPSALAGKESDWIQTVAGRSCNTLLSPLRSPAPWFDKTWWPGEIEAVQ